MKRASHHRKKVPQPDTWGSILSNLHRIPESELISKNTLDLLDQFRKIVTPEVRVLLTPDDSSDRTETVDRSTQSHRAPSRIGNYRIFEEIGHGGFGIVFRALDLTTGAEVALKCPRLSTFIDHDLRERFLREARSVSRINHPNLIRIHDSGVDRFIVYIAMELCPGPNLAVRLRNMTDPVPLATALELVLGVASGLEHAHLHGLIHRDVKPSNILLDSMPSGPADQACLSNLTPKLTDFGLAKSVEDDETLTRSGMIIGTPTYIAPEQADPGRYPVTSATDIHALGAVLYELVSGRPPYSGRSELETLQLIAAAEKPIPPSQLRSEISRSIDSICMRCLEKNPEDRYSSAQELCIDLRKALEGRTVVPPEPCNIRHNISSVNWSWNGLWFVSLVALFLSLGSWLVSSLALENSTPSKESSIATNFAEERRPNEAGSKPSVTSPPTESLTVNLVPLEDHPELQLVALDIYTRQSSFVQSQWINPTTDRQHTYMLVNLPAVPAVTQSKQLCECLLLNGLAGRLAAVECRSAHHHIVDMILDRPDLNRDPVVLIGLEHSPISKSWTWTTGVPCEFDCWRSVYSPSDWLGDDDVNGVVYRFFTSEDWIWDHWTNDPESQPTHLLIEFEGSGKSQL